MYPTTLKTIEANSIYKVILYSVALVIGPKCLNNDYDTYSL